MLSDSGIMMAILLGNSRVSRNGDVIEVEPQLRAFAAGLRCARNHRNVTGEWPRLSVAIDHQGVFRRQFLAAGLSNSATRNPNLAQLDSRIWSVFAPAARAEGVDLSLIHVLHEDSARSHAEHTFLKMAGDGRRKWIATKGGAAAQCGTTCALPGAAEAGAQDEEPAEHVTCAAVTREYYLSCMRGFKPGATAALQVFIENDPWSSVPVYVRGAALAGALGDSFALRLHLVQKNGDVRSGKFCCLNRQVAMDLQSLDAICVDGEAGGGKSAPYLLKEPRVLTLRPANQEQRREWPESQESARVA